MCVMQKTHIAQSLFPAPEVTGVILAGGKSKRMGHDKAALHLAGQPILRGVQRALAQVCARVQIAGDRPDLASVELPAFADRYPGSSLGGLHNALANTHSEWVLILPCDLPYPSPRLLQQLLEGRQGVQAVMPKTAAGIDPLIACYHRSILPLIERQLSHGNLRLTDLLDQLSVCYLDEQALPPGWRRALTNLNRPQDLAALQACPPALTLVAPSGTGKTSLLVRLIAEMTKRGWTVGALKHDAHCFEIDHEGKDSWKMTAAGATLTAISSPDKTALIRKHELEPSLDQLLQPFCGQVDLLLTEGFKRSSLPKIEVYRRELEQPLLCRGQHNDPALIAVASNQPLALDVPCFDLDDSSSLCDFIEERFLR